MRRDKLLDIVFFRTDTGAEPVRDWLRSLGRDEKARIGGDLLAVQRTWPIGRPLVGSLGEGLWEVRSRLKDRIARVLFVIDGEEMILLARLYQERAAHSEDRFGFGEEKEKAI